MRPVSWPYATLAIATAAVLAQALSTAGCARLGPEAPRLSVTTDKPTNVVSAASDGTGGVTVDVQSESGIGSAEVASTSSRLPNRVSLRFHLRGLEEMRFAYGDTTVTVSVSSGPGNPVSESVTVGAAGGASNTVAPGDGYWMAVEILGEDGQPASISLKNGYIQVEAPDDFLKSGVRAFGIHWIDFYR